MKFICNECGKPCILDTGDDTSLEVADLGCVVKNSCYCNWRKYEDGKVATNLQPTCNQLATNLPKITAEVFDRPDCPEWAQIAVVNRNGEAYYGGYKDARINCSGGWRGLYDEQGKWKRIGDELFDATDWQNSLIERPAKLPDWCKVGEWFWHPEDMAGGRYLKITEIRGGGVYAKEKEDYDPDYLCFDLVRKYSKQARLRPYKAEEMKALVGKIVCDTDGNNELITGWSVDMEKVRFNSIYYSAPRLLDEKFTIDGKPCGTFEHWEEGEWVK